jgi:hypothetical protein
MSFNGRESKGYMNRKFESHLNGDVCGLRFQRNHRRCLSGYTPEYIEAWQVIEYPRSVLSRFLNGREPRKGICTRLSAFSASRKTVSKGLICADPFPPVYRASAASGSFLSEETELLPSLPEKSSLVVFHSIAAVEAIVIADLGVSRRD